MNPLIFPQWPKPACVMACSTTRQGGVSLPPWNSLNPGAHCGDNPDHVQENRERLARLAGLPAPPVWLSQVHGTQVLTLTDHPPAGRTADASYTRHPGVVCAVMTADCLPVLFCAQSGEEVAAAHAGWRGLCAGILERTVAHFQSPPARILAWLGPAIGPQAFEVGDDVRSAFCAQHPGAGRAFRPIPGRPGKYLADLYQLARQRLSALGVSQIYGANYCTYQQADQFFSWRRDGQATGRMASLIWRQT